MGSSSGVRRKFSYGGGGSFSGTRWSFVFSVRCLWRHNLTAYSCFKTNVLAVFVDIICMFLYTHSPYFMGHCTDYKQSALQVQISEENKLNATTQQFITAKISSCALKQRSKTHSSLRQSNLQLQNEAVANANVLPHTNVNVLSHTSGHRKCAAGLARAHHGLRDGILLNYTRIENAHKVRKKTINFLLCKEVQQTFSFPFCLLRHFQMPECFCIKNSCFWARATDLQRLT